MSKRRTHSPEFKARVAMEAISGPESIQEIATNHNIGTPEKGIRRLDPNTANKRRVAGPDSWLYSGQETGHFKLPYVPEADPVAARPLL